MSDPSMLNTPMNIEAEQATLGAMLLNHEIAVEMLAELQVDDFPSAQHRAIFDAIRTVAEAGTEVDVITVGEEMRKRGVLADCGGPEYLMRLPMEVPTSYHAYRYADIVTEVALKRRLIRLGGELATRVAEERESPSEVLSWAAGQIADVASSRSRSKGARSAKEIAGELWEDLMRKMTEPRHTSAVRLGVPKLDHYMGGLRNYGLVVPRAREKTGKSVLTRHSALTSAVKIAEAGLDEWVVCYLLEGAEVWLEGAAAWLANVNSNIFTPSQFAVEDEQRAVKEARRVWEALPISVTGQLFDVDEIILDLRRIAMKQPVGLALIDYAQLIQGGSGNSGVERMEYCANRIAATAAELGCTIIVPSQLTDSDGERKSKWARAWDEAATLVFDIERGDEGMKREEWMRARNGRLRLHASRRRPPFAVHHIEFDLPTGRIFDATPPEESAGYAGA